MFSKPDKMSYVIETKRLDEEMPNEIGRYIGTNNIPFRHTGFNEGSHIIVILTRDQYRDIKHLVRKYNLTIRKGLM